MSACGSSGAKPLTHDVPQHDATADPGDLEKIVANAAAHCPAHARPLCREIEKQGREALREARQR